MGGRGSSSGNGKTPREKALFKSWDKWHSDRQAIKEKERKKKLEYIKQGVVIMEAKERAAKDFEKEYERVDNEREKRDIEIKEKYRAKQK